MNASFSIRRLLLSVTVFGYVLTSLTLSGIPGWSRLSLGFFLFLFSLVLGYAVAGRLSLRRWIIAPVVFVAISGLLAVVAEESAIDALKTLGIAWGGAVAVALSVQNSVHMRVVLAAFVAASAANALAVVIGFDAYAIYAADFREVSEQALIRRPSGLVGNSNLLAVQAWLAVLALVIWHRGAHKALWLIALPCAAHALLVTGSRKGVFLAAAAVFAALLIFGGVRRIRAMALTAVVTLALSSVLWLASIDASLEQSLREVVAIDRIYRAFEGSDTSFSDRYDFLVIGWRLFLESPLLGHGLDMFRHASGTGLYAHNNFIELAVSGGILLLGSYYAIHLGILFGSLRTHRRRDPLASVIWIVLLVILALDFSMVSYNTKAVALVLALLLSGVGLRGQQCAQQHLTINSVHIQQRPGSL